LRVTLQLRNQLRASCWFCKHIEIKELVKDTVTVSYFTTKLMLAPSTEISWAINALDETMAPGIKAEKYK